MKDNCELWYVRVIPNQIRWILIIDGATIAMSVKEKLEVVIILSE